MIAQHKRKLDNHEDAQIWHARLGHISKDRIKRLVDSKSLEIDNLDHLPTRESCLKGKRRFSYFITFTDDHSWYGYVYLMRYKSEAFGRFKEYRLEVENQTNRKIKALRSNRGGEYLNGEFIDYLKENGILSQWTPPGTPKLNGVAERRNRTLLDMVRSMMSFTELPSSFWGYALEKAAKLLNIAPSKSVPQTPYEIWHGKPASYKYLRVWDSPAYVKRLVGDKLDSRSSLCSRHDEVFIEESNEELHRDTTTSFEPTIHIDSVPVLRRSTRESRVPDRYGFVGLTSQLDNDPKTYGEAMSDIDSDKWLEAMKSKMDSMGSNQVWTLVDPPKGARPVGCKWVYKRKLGADGEVTAFKARLVAKGYTQRPGVDFEETYSPVAMAKSIRILLAWYDYKIWQMDVKTAFLNGFVEKEIFMDQSEGFTAVGEEQKVCVSKGDIKAWLSTQFSIKDMGEASYILGIKIYRDRSRSRRKHTVCCPVYQARCRLRFERNEQILGMRRGGALGAVKSIPKYLKRTKDMFLIYGGGELILEGYSDASFQSDDDDAKSQSSFVFKLNGGVVAWKSFKQDTTADSTTEAEYIAASEAAKEAIWMKNYIQELGVVPSIAEPVVIFCDNNRAIAQAKEPRSHHRSKHILRRYHLLREMVSRGDYRWTESA
ncbi:UNVERIFIED_CONTAM: Retrovirus-related Pol polyprotein from transposon TNT 1-94 [Sesamum latifolium]|uniref:Retrovirus-related Pol polyprotein from transposon TNT 1-94 n=1 Tax=Sesamum latifolium TaxID=2727402 RepID=A0AAW2TEM0_9LAMI